MNSSLGDTTTVRNREWTREEDKLFEDALAQLDINSSNFFENVMAILPWKTLDEIKSRYEQLIDDVLLKEASHFLDKNDNVRVCRGDKPSEDALAGNNNEAVAENKRKSWTEEEHRSFLEGLTKYGKGEWVNISENYVPTKTPSQVASHAQKYFRRVKCKTPVQKRRHSIHDIRMYDNSVIIQHPPRNPNYHANHSSKQTNHPANNPDPMPINQDPPSRPPNNDRANYAPVLNNQDPPANYTNGLFDLYADYANTGLMNQYSSDYTTGVTNPPTWHPNHTANDTLNEPAVDPFGSSNNDNYNYNCNYDCSNNYGYDNIFASDAPLIDYASSSGSNNVEIMASGNKDKKIVNDDLFGFGAMLTTPYNYWGY